MGTRIIAAVTCVLLSACWGSSPSSPLPTMVQVGGQWRIAVRINSVTGGECASSIFQPEVGRMITASHAARGRHHCHWQGAADRLRRRLRLHRHGGSEQHLAQDVPLFSAADAHGGHFRDLPEWSRSSPALRPHQRT